MDWLDVLAVQGTQILYQGWFQLLNYIIILPINKLVILNVLEKKESSLIMSPNGLTYYANLPRCSWPWEEVLVKLWGVLDYYQLYQTKWHWAHHSVFVPEIYDFYQSIHNPCLLASRGIMKITRDYLNISIIIVVESLIHVSVLVIPGLQDVRLYQL